MSAQPASPPDDAQDAILDAARATVLDFGVRRTTVSEVARRAGLSRMTVYRRYPEGAEMMRALMTREFGAVVAQVQDETADAATIREGVVTAAAHTVELLMTHPLMLRLLELEPELLLPYFVERLGRFQQLARDTAALRIAEGQAEGTIRAGDPALLAATIETAGRGLVLAARAHDARARSAALAEYTRLVDSYLRP